MPPDRLPVPRTVTPSLNVTVPVAVDGVIVDVKVTDAPNADGLGLDVTTSVVTAGFTFWVRGADVDAVKFALPP
jgi:hypothetical protein